jgi:class 3 adenylate cyclase
MPRSPSNLEEARKHITTLVAEVRPAMAWSSHRDPEEERRVVAPVLELMAEAVRRYGGTVSQLNAGG